MKIDIYTREHDLPEWGKRQWERTAKNVDRRFGWLRLVPLDVLEAIDGILEEIDELNCERTGRHIWEAAKRHPEAFAVELELINAVEAELARRPKGEK